MLVNYCDMCGQPLKDGQQWLLYIAQPTPRYDEYKYRENSMEDYLRKIEKEVKELCPTCKHLFDKIFEYRLEGMSKLTEDCQELFNLPPHNPDKKDKQEK